MTLYVQRTILAKKYPEAFCRTKTRATAKTKKKLQRKSSFSYFFSVFHLKKTLTVENWIKMKRKKNQSLCFIYENSWLNFASTFWPFLSIARSLHFLVQFGRCFPVAIFLICVSNFLFLTSLSIEFSTQFQINAIRPEEERHQRDFYSDSFHSFVSFFSTVVRGNKIEVTAWFRTFVHIQKDQARTYSDIFRWLLIFFSLYRVCLSILFLSHFLFTLPLYVFLSFSFFTRSVSLAQSRSICAFRLRAVYSSFLLLAFAGLCSLIVW